MSTHPHHWEKRRILIWGKTRPELSQSYREIVCTGGVFEDTRRLVRIYPVPLRYMDDEKVFKKYQWIEAYVARNPSDPRPESYKIRADGIEIGEVIRTKRGNWDRRAEWILQPENLFQSVEALQARESADKTSLGLIAPAEVREIRAERVSRSEKEGFNARYEEAVRQMDLPLDESTGREIKPLRPPDFRFKVSFRCDDSQCKGHEFSVLDWEADALYFRQRTQAERSPQRAAQDVVSKLEEMCGPDKDLRFYLGNISNRPKTFTIVGLWYPKKKPEERQARLFD